MLFGGKRGDRLKGTVPVDDLCYQSPKWSSAYNPVNIEG